MRPRSTPWRSHRTSESVSFSIRFRKRARRDVRRVDLTSTADPSIPRVSGVVADIMKSPKVAELDRLKKEQQQRRRARGAGSARGAVETRGNSNPSQAAHQADDPSPRQSEDESDDTRAAPAGTSARAATAAASASAHSDGNHSAHEGTDTRNLRSNPTASATERSRSRPRNAVNAETPRERKPPGRYAAYEIGAIHSKPRGRTDDSIHTVPKQSHASRSPELIGSRREAIGLQSPPRTRGEQRRSWGAGSAGTNARGGDPTLQWRRVVVHGYPPDTKPHNVERLFVNLRVNAGAVERTQLIRNHNGTVIAFAQFATEGDARLVIDTLARKADRGNPITFRSRALSATHLHDWPRNLDKPRWVPCVAAPGWTPDPRNDVGQRGDDLRIDEPAPMNNNNNNNNNNVGPPSVKDFGRWEKFGPKWWECHVDTRGHMGGVIGKGGATIRKLQADTGSKMRWTPAGVDVVVWANNEAAAAAGARAVFNLVADLVADDERAGRPRRISQPAAKVRVEPRGHNSDPEDGEIRNGAVVPALGGHDALDFTDVLPGGSSELNDAARAGGEDPEGKVGARVRIFWPAEGRYYAGVVDAWDARTRKHVVKYDDGDVERVDLARETWERADDAGADDADEPAPDDEAGPVRATAAKRRGRERTPDLPRVPADPAPVAVVELEPALVPVPDPPDRVTDQHHKTATCDACGKGPYNAKGLQLHLKMWCKKDGPNKKKGKAGAPTKTPVPPSDLAKKRPRVASVDDRFGFVDEAGGENPIDDDAVPGEGPSPSFDEIQTRITDEFASRSELESILRNLESDDDASETVKGMFVRVRLKRKNGGDSGYACAQVDYVTRFQPGMKPGMTPARDEGWEWKVHFGAHSSPVRYLSNSAPGREEVYGWFRRHFVDGEGETGGGKRLRRH